LAAVFDKLKRLRSEAMQYSRYIYFRSLSAAEDTLRSIKSKVESLGEAGRGFYDALNGLYVAITSDDRNTFYYKLYYDSSPDDVESYKDKLLNEAYRETADEYERGFTLAWEAILSQLAELKRQYPPKVEKPQEPSLPKSVTEMLKGDESIEIKPRRKPKSEQPKKSS